MTTPEEHRRALGRTIQTLKDVSAAAAAGSALRDRALHLLTSAVSIEKIEQLDTASPERVEAAINSIQDSRALFESALRELHEPRVRLALEVALRHYPDGIQLELWRILLASGGSPMGGVISRTAGPLAW
jgi:hypothetical protein